MENHNPTPTTYNPTAEEWAEFYGDEPVPAPDDAYERFTEERDAWLFEEEEGVTCDGCGIVCDAVDAVSDDVIALCGSVYGNGCADMAGAFEYS